MESSEAIKQKILRKQKKLNDKRDLFNKNVTKLNSLTKNMDFKTKDGIIQSSPELNKKTEGFSASWQSSDITPLKKAVDEILPISKQFENSLRFDTDGHITSINKMGLYTNERNLNTGEKLHSFKFPSLYEPFGFSSEISSDGKIEHSLSNPFPTLFDKQVSLSAKAPGELFLKTELEMRGGPGASMWYDDSFAKEVDLNENQGVELSACYKKSCVHFKY